MVVEYPSILSSSLSINNKENIDFKTIEGDEVDEYRNLKLIHSFSEHQMQTTQSSKLKKINFN